MRKQQLTSLLVERYISLLHITSDTEREEVKQMLYKDESLMSIVDRIMDITTSCQGGTWASFLGFREVRQSVKPINLESSPLGCPLGARFSEFWVIHQKIMVIGMI